MVFAQAGVVVIVFPIILTSFFLPIAHAVCTIRPNDIVCMTGPQGTPVCITGPTGGRLCAGMSQTINITKSSSATNMTHGNPDVIIRPNCASEDMSYGSYLHTCYQPNTFYVKPGTIAVWKNDDMLPHTVTSGSPIAAISRGYYFDSKAIEPGASFSYKFKFLGAYPYFDSFNWWETGLVIVRK